MEGPMLRQEFTLDNMDTLNFVYEGQPHLLEETGKDEAGNQYIEIPTNGKNNLRITLESAGRKKKDWVYRVTCSSSSYTYASYAHLLDGLPMALAGLKAKGVEVML